MWLCQTGWEGGVVSPGLCVGGVWAGVLGATHPPDGPGPSPPWLQIWNNDRQISLLHSTSMKKYNWSYTQFSQFNADDSLLLVSGVFMGPRSSSSGEIAVIGLGKETCRAPSETLESPDAPPGQSQRAAAEDDRMGAG